MFQPMRFFYLNLYTNYSHMEVPELRDPSLTITYNHILNTLWQFAEEEKTDQDFIGALLPCRFIWMKDSMSVSAAFSPKNICSTFMPS